MARKLNDKPEAPTDPKREGLTCELDEVARTHIMSALDSGDLPEKAWIAYHGEGAHRPNEPGMIISFCTYDPHVLQLDDDRDDSPCYCIKYMDGEVKWFRMDIPTRRPPVKRDMLGRKKPTPLWAEMLPDFKVRPGARVIGRHEKDDA